MGESAEATPPDQGTLEQGFSHSHGLPLHQHRARRASLGWGRLPHAQGCCKAAASRPAEFGFIPTFSTC